MARPKVNRQAKVDELEHQLTVLFRRARGQSAQIAARVHPDLDAAGYGLLVLLDEHQPIRGTDLAERVGLNKSTVSRQIAALVELGLVTRDQVEGDRRAAHLRVSDVGGRRLEAVRNARRADFAQRISEWPDDDLTEFARLLRRLNVD